MPPRNTTILITLSLCLISSALAATFQSANEPSSRPSSDDIRQLAQLPPYAEYPDLQMDAAEGVARAFRAEDAGWNRAKTILNAAASQ